MRHLVIGEASTESGLHQFECPAGHRITANHPVTIGYYSDHEKGPPICPHCLIDYIRKTFPMTRIMARMVPVAVPEAGQVLGPTIVAKDCATSGCILKEHPPGTQHIGQNRQEFS